MLPTRSPGVINLRNFARIFQIDRKDIMWPIPERAVFPEPIADKILRIFFIYIAVDHHSFRTRIEFTRHIVMVIIFLINPESSPQDQRKFRRDTLKFKDRIFFFFQNIKPVIHHGISDGDFELFNRWILKISGKASSD
jgi:hypothetical protein